MGKEIERKFLLTSDAWRALAKGTAYRQGYLNSAKERTVRIRTVGDKAFLTIKGLSVGVTRSEYEYPIPFDDCNAMLDNLAEKPLIEKNRYKIALGGLEGGPQDAHHQRHGHDAGGDDGACWIEAQREAGDVVQPTAERALAAQANQQREADHRGR